MFNAGLISFIFIASLNRRALHFLWRSIIRVFKTERTLYERCVEHAWNDKDSVVFNHLNECIGVQHMFEIGKLTPSLLTNNIIDDEFDLRSSRVNLVQMNARNIRAFIFNLFVLFVWL